MLEMSSTAWLTWRRASNCPTGPIGSGISGEPGIEWKVMPCALRLKVRLKSVADPLMPGSSGPRAMPTRALACSSWSSAILTAGVPLAAALTASERLSRVEVSGAAAVWASTGVAESAMASDSAARRTTGRSVMADLTRVGREKTVQEQVEMRFEIFARIERRVADARPEAVLPERGDQ